MNLTITKEKVTPSLGFFGGGFRLRARLDVSEEEAQCIVRKALGGMELASLPNSMGRTFASQPLYLGELLNREWEHKCKNMDDANSAEEMIIEALKRLKEKLKDPSQGHGGAGGTKTIEI